MQNSVLEEDKILNNNDIESDNSENSEISMDDKEHLIDEKVQDNDVLTQINALEQKLNDLNQKYNELNERYLRSVAELDNTIKRNSRQLEESSKYAVSNFAKALLDVIDNLIRATSSIPQTELQNNEFLQKVNEGLNMTEQNFMSVLNKFGIKRIRPEIGDGFDHNFHQAVTTVEASEVKNGNIVNVMQDGYQIYDRLLRPAMVSVAK